MVLLTLSSCHSELLLSSVDVCDLVAWFPMEREISKEKSGYVLVLFKCKLYK